MEFNIEDYINSLPLSITKINVSKKRLTYLPDLSRFKQLTQLFCFYNQLTSLPPLNNTLTHLYCDHNQLIELPPLNNNLTVLYCHHNQLTWLPPLNNKLVHIFCYNNNIFNNHIKFSYGNKNIIKTLRNFRYTYYLLKFKKHFKRW